MEPKAAEVVPKVIIKEKPVAPATPRPTSEVVEKSRQRLEEGAWREANQIIKEPPIEQKKISERLEQFGTTRNATTGVKELTAQEQARRDRAETAANLAKKFIEDGYDNMTDTEQDSFRDVFLDEAKLRPFLEQEMQGMNDAQKKAFAERYLKDPRFTKELREVFNRLLDPERRFTDISTFQEEKEKADLDIEDAKAEREDHKRLWELNDSRLKEYEVRPSAARGRPPEKGARLQRLEGLEEEVRISRNDLDVARRDLSGIQSDANRLRNELNLLQRQAQSGLQVPGGRTQDVVRRELEALSAREISARERVSQLDGEVAVKEGERDSLNAERDSLLESRKELDAERRRLERKYKDAERAVIKRQWELQDATAIRTGEEEDLVNGFENVFSDAGNNILNTEVEKANEAFTAELESLKQQTTDQNKKALYDALSEEFLGPTRYRKRGLLGFRRTEAYRPISKAKTNAIHDGLMRGGPEGTTRDLLKTRINPATNANYTDSEIDTILADKNFVNEMQPEVVKQVLARKILVSGLAKEDVHIIVNSQWGKGMITKAIETNDEFRKAVEDLTGTPDIMGTKALESQGFWGRFGSEMGRKRLLWLLLLGVVGMPLAAALLASKERGISA